MKVILFLIGMVCAGILGYFYEPDLRFRLTGIPPAVKKTVPRHIFVEIGAPGKTIVPATYPADQLPEKILLHAAAEVANEAGDLKMSIPAGSRVNLVRVESTNAVISPGADSFEGQIPISQTDLVEQLRAKPEPAATAQTVPEMNPTVDPIPETPVESTIQEPVAEPEMVDDTPEPVVPDPEPAVPDDPVDVVAVMQASIQAGEIKEFTFDKVLDWKASEELENIDGQSYQTGIASYKAETVFGLKTIQAKALIKDGKVTRWLWPKSGLEIK